MEESDEVPGTDSGMVAPLTHQEGTLTTYLSSSYICKVECYTIKTNCGNIQQDAQVFQYTMGKSEENIKNNFTYIKFRNRQNKNY